MSIRLGLGLGTLAGFGLVLWYKVLKPFDRMIVLSEELEEERSWPAEPHRSYAAANSDLRMAESLQKLVIATSCAPESGSVAQSGDTDRELNRSKPTSRVVFREQP